MTAVEILLQKYSDKFVPLSIVAADYYGINSPELANQYATQQKFNGLKPFKAFESKKAPWLVDIDNLAKALDSRARG